MSLIAEALTDIRRTGHDCEISRILTDHPKLAADILELLAARHISAAAAHRTLERHGIVVPAQTIRRHRLGECSACRRAGRNFKDAAA